MRLSHCITDVVGQAPCTAEGRKASFIFIIRVEVSHDLSLELELTGLDLTWLDLT